MRSHEVFDADEDPQESRRARRHRLYRFGAPVVAVLLMAAGLVGIAIYNYQSNRDTTLALSNDLLVVVEQQVHVEVANYLQPAENALQTLAAAAFDPPFDPANRQLLERLGMHVLRDAPMVALISIADPAGNYMQIRRNEVGGMDTKLMERDANRLTTTWTRRDADNRVISTEPDPKDTFDPRTRPWFSGALDAEGISWTDAYVFYTDKKPGVTASLATRLPDGSPGTIIGVDISLDELSNFLNSLRVSRRSESLIVDDKGNVIASRQPTNPMSEGEELRLPRVPELNQPLVTQAYDRLRVSGPGRSIVGMDEQNYIIVGSSLANIVQRNWMLQFVVPEDDFVNSVARSTRTALAMSGAVIAMALLLAFLLIRQGLVTDRVARVLASRERDMDRQERAFAELGELASQTETGSKQMLRFTEAAARATNASSIRIWRFESDDSILCLDAYDRESNGHTSGFEIDRNQCPDLFNPVLRGQEVLIDDVTKDERLAGLRNLYPPQASGRNLLLVPLSRDNTVAGYIALENLPLPAARKEAIFLLVRTFARWLGPRLPMAGLETAAPTAASAGRGGSGQAAHLNVATDALRTASLMDDRARIALRNLNGQSRNGSAAVFANVTALNLRIRDDALLAPEGASRTGPATQVADAVRAACDRHAIRYVKILANDIVIADGFDGDPEDAAVRLASVALELRDHCTLLSRHHGRTPMFAMGIDCGSTLGAPLQTLPEVYNVWGDAIRVAQALASAAAPGTIQVSQTAYDYLNSNFLFRRAGAYYLDQIGEMATFTLRGRL